MRFRRQIAKFGPDHELTMQLLATGAQSEGSLGNFDDTVRDDLAIYDIAVKKQGPRSFYSIATLTDAALAQCRANHLEEGTLNAQKARSASIQGFGEHAALTGAANLTVASCLIGLGRLQEASKMLENIDTKAVVPLTGDPDWGADVTLAKAEIAVRQGNYADARKHLESVRPVSPGPMRNHIKRAKWRN